MNVPWVRFGRIPCIMMMLLSIGLLNHVLIGPLVLQSSGRDAWLAILAVSALQPLWLLLIYPIVRSIGSQPFTDWLKHRAGTVGKHAVVGILVVLLFMIIIVTCVDTVNWSSTTYLPETPKLVTSFVFVALGIAGSILGLHIIVYMSCFLLPLVSALGIFVASANIPRKDYLQLLPILENGWSPIGHGMIYVGGGYVELMLFVVLAGYVNRPFRRRHLIATGLFISLLCFGPVVAAISEFGPGEAMEQRFPAFAQWRLVQLGKYIEHVDFFAIYQWLSGSFVRTSASLCLILDLTGIRSRKKRAVIGAVIGIMAIFTSVYPFGDAAEFYFFSRYLPVSMYAFLALFLFLFLLSMIHATGKGGEGDVPERA